MTAAVAAAVTVIGAGGTQTTFFLWAFGTLIVGLTCAVLFVVKRESRQGSSARGALVVGLGCVAAFFAAAPLHRVFVNESRSRGNAIAVALNAHAAREGLFPASLDELVPRDLDEVPETAAGWFAHEPFGYWPSGGDFRLFFRSDFSRCERTSATPWQWWD